MDRAWRKTFWPYAALGILCAATAGCGRGPGGFHGRPAPGVIVATAQRKKVPIFGEYLGQTAAVNPVEIRSQVTGLLKQIAFTEGTTVKEGQLLFVIDPRPYQAALNQAEANLNQAKAALKDARQKLERDRVLVKRHVISQQQFDTQNAATEEAKATVEAEQAKLATAQLNLSFTRIYAPVTGRIGIAQVKVGGLVQLGSTLLDTIYSIDPMYVDFSITESAFLSYMTDRVKDQPALPSAITLILPDGAVYARKGRIVMTNPTVDPNTGTIGLRAEFPNPEGLLRPGLFVRVRMVTSENPKAVLVPEQALSEVQGQQSVMVVNADDMAKFQPVTTGPLVGKMRVITSGLKGGERIIVEGLQKVRPGMKVRPMAQSAKQSGSGGAGHRPAQAAHAGRT